MPRMSIVNILNLIMEKMYSGILADTDKEYLEIILDVLKDYHDGWQDRLDEQEANEPDTDAAHDLWDERHERMEERVALLEEIVDDLEGCIDDISAIEDEVTAKDDLKNELTTTASCLEDVLDKISDYNFTYKGLKSLKLDYKKQ